MSPFRQVRGNQAAISELESLKSNSNLEQNHLYHSTLGELYKFENKNDKAIKHFQTAIELTKNKRDVKLLRRKLEAIVPNCQTQLC